MKIIDIQDEFQRNNKLNTLGLIDELPARYPDNGTTIRRYNIYGMGSYRWCAVPSKIKEGDTFNLYLKLSTKNGVKYIAYEGQNFEENVISSLINHRNLDLN